MPRYIVTVTRTEESEPFEAANEEEAFNYWNTNGGIALEMEQTDSDVEVRLIDDPDHAGATS